MRFYGVILFSCICVILLVTAVQRLNSILIENYIDHISVNGKNVIFQGTPEDYQANEHVKFTSSVDPSNNYQFDFSFKGPKNRIWNWKWSYSETSTDQDILKFGVPKSLFEPYYPVDSVIQRRNRQMQSGLFMQDGRYIKPDLVQMVNYYSKYLQPLALETKKSLDAEIGPDTWRDYIEFFMKACQDIPYGVPPKNSNDKYIGGIFPPPQVFINKFGDCDSKAVIFCAGVSFFKNTEVIFLYETGHVLPAVKGIPKPYDAFYEYQNDKYIMADTAGPGRNPLGFNTNPYQKIIKVSKVVIQQ